jgi:hypothetical protein
MNGTIISIGVGSIFNTRYSDGFIAEYQAVYDQFVVKPSAADAEAQNIFVKTLVDGGVWLELDRLSVFASHASGVDSLIDWIHPSVAANNFILVNAPAWVQYQGYTGNGTTQYIDSNFEPSTDGVNFLQNSALVGMYSRTELSNISYDIGLTPASNSDIQLRSRFPGDLIASQLNNSGSNTVVNASSLGLFCISRFIAASFDVYKNGVNLTTEVGASIAPGSGNIFFGAYNMDGLGTPAGFSTRQYSMGVIGGNLDAPKQLILYNAFQALMTYYGTQV